MNKVKSGGFPKPKVEIIKVKDFVSEYLPITDCQPVQQRLDTTSWSKLMGIVDSMFHHIHFGAITICKVSNNPNGYVYESIDGGHRKRAIRNFVSSDQSLRFKFFGEYYSQLSPENRAIFDDYELTLVIYPELTGEQKGAIFQRINTTTPVNDQEMRNSFGDIAIANLIRELVRIVPGYNTGYHKFYTRTDSNEDNFKYLQQNNNRLKHEETLAQSVYRISKGIKGGKYLGSASQEEVTQMYAESDKLDIARIEKETNKFLDFMFECGKWHLKVYRRGLSKSDYRMLSYLWFYLKDTYKTFKIGDYEAFIKEYKAAYETVSDKEHAKYSKIIDLDFDTSGRTISEAFTKYLAIPDNKKKIVQAVNWFLQEFEPETVITIKDSKRVFSHEDKVRKLIEQDYKCYIETQICEILGVGEPETVTIGDCEAGHRTAHTTGVRNGGTTTYDNLVMIKKEHNRAMGSMSLEEYILVLLKRSKVA